MDRASARFVLTSAVLEQEPTMLRRTGTFPGDDNGSLSPSRMTAFGPRVPQNRAMCSSTTCSSQVSSTGTVGMKPLRLEQGRVL